MGTGGNERWVIRYREDVLNGSGRRVRVCRKTTIGRCSKLTKAMAQRAADELLSKGANSATFQPTTTITFSEFVGEKYLKMAMPNRKRAGRLTATSHLEHHLIPWFGEMPLAGINQEAVQQMATALLKSGLSLSTVRGVCAALGCTAATMTRATLIPSAAMVRRGLMGYMRFAPGFLGAVRAEVTPPLHRNVRKAEATNQGLNPLITQM